MQTKLNITLNINEAEELLAKHFASHNDAKITNNVEVTIEKLPQHHRLNEYQKISLIKFVIQVCQDFAYGKIEDRRVSDPEWVQNCPVVGIAAAKTYVESYLANNP